MNKLKPCPFCGVEPCVRKNYGGAFILKYRVVCANPSCRMNPHTIESWDLSDVESRWNRRASDDAD